MCCTRLRRLRLVLDRQENQPENHQVSPEPIDPHRQRLTLLAVFSASSSTNNRSVLREENVTAASCVCEVCRRHDEHERNGRSNSNARVIVMSTSASQSLLINGMSLIITSSVSLSIIVDGEGVDMTTGINGFGGGRRAVVE